MDGDRISEDQRVHSPEAASAALLPVGEPGADGHGAGLPGEEGRAAGAGLLRRPLHVERAGVHHAGEHGLVRAEAGEAAGAEEGVQGEEGPVLFPVWPCACSVTGASVIRIVTSDEKNSSMC